MTGCANDDASRSMQDAPCAPCGDQKLVHHAGTDESLPLACAISCAWAGVRYAWRSQRNLKIHMGFAVAAVLLAAILQVSSVEWLAIVICIFTVMGLEMVNTAVESVVDMVSPDWHELAKRAKDCAAGAVYIAAIGSLVIAAIIYIPHIVGFFV